MKNVAFIDRDGVLIWEPPETFQVDSLAKLRILPNVCTGLRALKAKGCTLVMVSNQDGLGTNSFPKEDYEIPHNEMLRQFDKEGIVFDAIFICPHLPSDCCACRKPKLGMVKNFLENTDVDYMQSIMIGDRDTDRQFAENIGIRFVRAQTNGSFPRFAFLQRQTNETSIICFVNLDGSGTSAVTTGIGFLDHMLELFAKHALIDLALNVQGDLRVDEHHTVEDTALALGGTLAQALGDKRGIERYGSTLRRSSGLTTSWFLLPMDEALAEIALDLSGRPYFVFEGSFKREYVGEFPTELVAHFFESFAQALKCNLQMTIRRGRNEHHKVEALFKGLGRCLRQAFRNCPHEQGIPSTKGSL